MRKNIKAKTALFPMPVLMIGTFNEDDTVDVMNAAWGMMVDYDKIILNLDESHKTVKNIMNRKSFTVSLADYDHYVEADYLGIVSANNTPDKFKKSGLNYIKSEFVDAPIIEEFPICMECEFIEQQEGENGCGFIGKIVNVSADEKILDETGKVDASKINSILYDTFNHGYYKVGEKVGQAFNDGNNLK